jgi:hypothetical protein
VVTIKTYQNVAQAGYAHSLLEAMGIHGFLHGEEAFQLGYPGSDGIRLQVEEEDIAKALGVLDQHEGLAPLPDDFVLPVTPEDEHEHPETSES